MSLTPEDIRPMRPPPLPAVVTRPGYKRRALFRVTWELFRGFGTPPGERVRVVSNDIPADAQIINIAYDWHRDQVVFVLESDQLAEWPDGKPLPYLCGPVWKTGYSETGVGFDSLEH